MVEGTRFARLTVMGYNSTDHKRRKTWDCLCDCGNSVIVPTNRLTSGTTKSCGCLNRETASKRAKKGVYKKHGGCCNDKWSPTYISWRNMKSRCINPNDEAYPDYGGRGITLCDKWLDFKSFLDDMGECPTGLTIERVNNAGNYEPANCIWDTQGNQNRNKRNNVLIEFRGEVKCMADWSTELGINRVTLTDRLKRGWSADRAFTTPVGNNGRN